MHSTIYIFKNLNSSNYFDMFVFQNIIFFHNISEYIHNLILEVGGGGRTGENIKLTVNNKLGPIYFFCIIIIIII